jgi:hypothetical protein
MLSMSIAGQLVVLALSQRGSLGSGEVGSRTMNRAYPPGFAHPIYCLAGFSMASKREATAQEISRTVAPRLVDYTRDLLFKDLWLRPDLASLDRRAYFSGA